MTAKSGHDLISPVNFGIVIACYAICLIMPNVNDMLRRYKVGLDSYQLPCSWTMLRINWSMTVPWACATAVAFVVAVVAILAAGQGSPFLYFQF